MIELHEMSKEERRAKFVSLAEKRVTRALRDIRLIGNLSNTANYNYSPEDVRKIHSSLKRALDEMKMRFETKGSEKEDLFKL